LSDRFRRAAAYSAGLAATQSMFGLAMWSWHATDHVLADDLPAPAVASSNPLTDPARVEGHEKCIDCHVPEVRAWMASKHATRAFDLLRTSPTSREYAKQLGIRPADIARNSICVTCHATPQRDHTGHSNVIGGVSCEACHNGSGGDDGWLNPHAVYGPRGTRRDNETADHLSERQARCRTAGQLRSADTYQLVKRCFACHVVSDEQLAEAGHQHGDRFALVEKMLGEVRHNFFRDPQRNSEAATLWLDPLHHGEGRTTSGRKRVLFVVGQLVDLETSLRSLAKATDENDFSDLMIERIEDAFGLLEEDLLEELETTTLPEIERVVELVQPVIEKLDDDGFDPADAKLYLDAASEVAKIAETFGNRDGNKLAEIDELDLIPEGPFEGVYQPNRHVEPVGVP